MCAELEELLENVEDVFSADELAELQSAYDGFCGDVVEVPEGGEYEDPESDDEASADASLEE